MLKAAASFWMSGCSGCWVICGIKTSPIFCLTLRTMHRLNSSSLGRTVATIIPGSRNHKMLLAQKVSIRPVLEQLTNFKPSPFSVALQFCGFIQVPLESHNATWPHHFMHYSCACYFLSPQPYTHAPSAHTYTIASCLPSSTLCTPFIMLYPAVRPLLSLLFSEEPSLVSQIIHPTVVPLPRILYWTFSNAFISLP